MTTLSSSHSSWRPQAADFTGTIGVFDSGIGGLSVAAAIGELLPDESMLYVADNAYAPYGPRPASEILARSRAITRLLISAGVKMIVVACNTATSIAIETLREEFPEIPFVGLEPAVKPAAAGLKIGVLATTATLGSPRYLALKERHLADRPVFEDACVGLVPLIEADGPGSSSVKEKLTEILRPMLAEGVDTLVLGCTHYPLVADDFAAICGPAVALINPAPAAARQAARLLPTTGSGTRVRAHTFCTTGSAVPLQRTLLTLPELNRFRKLVVPRVHIPDSGSWI